MEYRSSLYGALLTTGSKQQSPNFRRHNNSETTLNSAARHSRIGACDRIFHPHPALKFDLSAVRQRPYVRHSPPININGMAHVILTVSQCDKARTSYSALLPHFGMRRVHDGPDFVTTWARVPRSEFASATLRSTASAFNNIEPACTTCACARVPALTLTTPRHWRQAIRKLNSDSLESTADPMALCSSDTAQALCENGASANRNRDAAAGT